MCLDLLYIRTYMHTYNIIAIIYAYTANIHMYVLYVHIFSVSSSVTDAEVIMITPEDATNTTYSITVTCTIHPDSDANMCEVTTANGQTLTGEYIIYT